MIRCLIGKIAIAHKTDRRTLIWQFTLSYFALPKTSNCNSKYCSEDKSHGALSGNSELKKALIRFEGGDSNNDSGENV